MSMNETQAKAPAELKALASWLRNKSGMKTRLGALGGKRVDYFKGKSAIKALLSPSYAKLKGVPPPPPDSAGAIALLHQLIPFTFYLRVERGASIGGSGGPKLVQITPQQLFAEEEYYVWLLEANPVKQLAMAFGMVVVVLAGVMFPLWPAKMRVGVWYLSIGVLGLIGLFFLTAIVRLIVWLVTIVAVKPGIWIFPNLFADVGFVDSFIPLWGWDVPPPKKVRSSKKKQRSEREGKESKSASAAGANDHGHSHSGESHSHSHSHGEDPRIVEIVDGEEDD